MKAVVRTILGDDPDTITNDSPALIRDDVTSAVCVEVSGLGHVLYSPEQDRAMFTQGPGTERDVGVAHDDNGDTVITVIKNGAGQRRMVVVLSD